MKALFLCLFLCLVASLNVEKRTLVVYDESDIKNSHSSFFEQLTSRGYQLTFKRVDDASIELERFGEYKYDNLILMIPSSELLAPGLSVKSILDFVGEGGKNLMITASNELNDILREIAIDCDVEFDVADSLVTDHQNYHESMDSGDHTTVTSGNFLSAAISTDSLSPVIFRGLGMRFDPGNHLLLPLLKGSLSSYSFDEDERRPHVAGENTILVGGLQTRSHNRVTFVGSLDLFSNEFYDATVKGKLSGNEKFAEELSKWAFQEKGVLRHRDVSIHPPNEAPKEQYRITTPLEYNVVLEEWDGSSWKPFVANDVQLEFVMLDPYHRMMLPHVKDGHYQVTFQIPDHYGIFKCVVDYRRVGYTILNFQDQVTVRPVRTDEFERFIHAANPYYISVGCMIAGFFVFSFVFLYMKEGKKKVD